MHYALGIAGWTKRSEAQPARRATNSNHSETVKHFFETACIDSAKAETMHQADINAEIKHLQYPTGNCHVRSLEDYNFNPGKPTDVKVEIIVHPKAGIDREG